MTTCIGPRRAGFAVGFCACAGLLALAAGGASAQSGVTELVTKDTFGDPAGGGAPAISADGSVIAFQSFGQGLDPLDTNFTLDVFAWEGGLIRLVSRSTAGAAGNNPSGNPALSADGSAIAFTSLANNLVAGDANSRFDIFVRTSASTARANLSSAGAEANNQSDQSALSADGRYVVFQSNASNLLPGDPTPTAHVYRRDNQTGAIVRLDVNGGAIGNAEASRPSISGDGQFVAFASLASNLASGDTNNLPDIFVRDVLNGTTARVSVSSQGAQALGESLRPRITGDGRFVAFDSTAANLVGDDTNGLRDVFVRDTLLGTTVRASTGPGGIEGDGESWGASLSADGRFVAFVSSSTTFDPTDTNGLADVYVKDLLTGRISRESAAVNGGNANGAVNAAALSASGLVLAFESTATNLTSPGTVGANVFRRQVNCPADYDQTGFADSDDFVLYADQFSRGCTGAGEGALGADPDCARTADFDQSGFVDSDDFVNFIVGFAAGCP
jgi:Tol biopolymer transport system component